MYNNGLKIPMKSSTSGTSFIRAMWRERFWVQNPLGVYNNNNNNNNKWP